MVAGAQPGRARIKPTVITIDLVSFACRVSRSRESLPLLAQAVVAMATPIVKEVASLRKESGMELLVRTRIRGDRSVGLEPPVIPESTLDLEIRSEAGRGICPDDYQMKVTIAGK